MSRRHLYYSPSLSVFLSMLIHETWALKIIRVSFIKGIVVIRLNLWPPFSVKWHDIARMFVCWLIRWFIYRHKLYIHTIILPFDFSFIKYFIALGVWHLDSLTACVRVDMEPGDVLWFPFRILYWGKYRFPADDRSFFFSISCPCLPHLITPP